MQHLRLLSKEGLTEKDFQFDATEMVEMATHLGGTVEADNQGQVVIYTGLRRKEDGTFEKIS